MINIKMSSKNGKGYKAINSERVHTDVFSLFIYCVKLQHKLYLQPSLYVWAPYLQPVDVQQQGRPRKRRPYIANRRAAVHRVLQMKLIVS